MSIIVPILLFSILVIVHELGHMVAAKKAGVHVLEFAVGMGPKLLSKKFGETIYSLRLFPIGGFCQMLGEDEELNDPRAFNNQKPLPRFIILVAGAFMNIVLALVISVFIVAMTGFQTTQISQLSPDTNAEAAGLLPGDIITKIDTMRIHVFDDIKLALFFADGSPIDIEVKRANPAQDGPKFDTLALKVIPVHQDGEYRIGFYPKSKLGVFQNVSEYPEAKELYETASFTETISQASKVTVYYVKSAYYGILKLITRHIGTDQMSGPIGIVTQIGEVYEESAKISLWAVILNMAYLMALLSANLGALNLLPLPALDGGRILFVLLEAIRRKPLPADKEGVIHFAGFMLLIALMLFVAYNDISRIIVQL